MKRVVVEKPGGFDRLVIKDAPDLEACVGQVVVDVAAVGLSYADSIVRMGYYKSARTLVGYPITPGFEFAGKIAKLGEGVTELNTGQSVFGVSLFNSYATQVRVPAHQVFLKPDSLSIVQAATFPTVFMTAWYAAVKQAQIRPGMIVIVHSAAGGVGSALVQVCKLLGAQVVGLVGQASKVEIARSMGCDHVVDKSVEDAWRKVQEFAPGGYDVVFDATGATTLKQSYSHLRPTGRLITYGFHSMFSQTADKRNLLKLIWMYWKTPRFNPIRMAEDNKSILAFNLSFLFDRREILSEGMQTLLRWLDEGKIHPLLVKEYQFNKVAQAQHDIESGQTVGKLALVI